MTSALGPMLRRLRDEVAHRAPWVGRYKRQAVAYRERLRASRYTYAQQREDVEVVALLDGMNISSAVYIDVGANHPMSISNTYLLYRKGCRGVVVEPNLELAMLFERHRPRDLTIAAACSDKRGVARFTLSKTPALSALDPNHVPNPWRSVLVPVITVDDVIAELDPAWVSVLTVDVEGISGAVLRGATNALERTLVVCVEAAPGAEEDEVRESLAAGFQVVRHNGTNIIAVSVDRARFDRFRAR